MSVAILDVIFELGMAKSLWFDTKMGMSLVLIMHPKHRFYKIIHFDSHLELIDLLFILRVGRGPLQLGVVLVCILLDPKLMLALLEQTSLGL